MEKKTSGPVGRDVVVERGTRVVPAHRPDRDLAGDEAFQRLVIGAHVDVALVVGVAGDERFVGAEEGDWPSAEMPS